MFIFFCFHPSLCVSNSDKDKTKRKKDLLTGVIEPDLEPKVEAAGVKGAPKR